MNYKKHLEWAVFLTILINAAAILSPIINSGDAITYATLAHNIVLNHDWVRLTLDGHDWLDKPHFPFWVTAFFFKLGGVSSFTYILPGFIFHLIGAYFTYRLARMFYNKQTALLSLLIYVSIYNLMDASIEVKAETYLIGQIMPACYYWLRYDSKFRIKYLLLGSLFTAMAIMTKGIFTLFTIGSGLLCLWLFQRQWLKLFSFKWLGALALSLLLVLPELIALHLQFNQTTVNQAGADVSSIKFFFWDSQFGRFFNSGPIQNHNGHPLYFVLVFLWAFLPWSIIFFAAIRSQLKSFRGDGVAEQKSFIFLSASFLFTFLMFSATKFQFDYYIDIILPFAGILCARYLYKSNIPRTLFVTQMGIVFLLALITISLGIYVMNMILLGIISLILIGMLYYFYSTRTSPLNFRTISYSVFAINLLYFFLVSLTATTFMKYSIPYNAEKLFGQQSADPIFIYQMPEVTRELSLYSDATCIEIDSFDSIKQVSGEYYLIIRNEQEEQLKRTALKYHKLAAMDLVVHKTGTFNKLLQLARGTRPLERIDFLQSSP